MILVNILSVFFRKKIKFTQKIYFFLHISSRYAKILGQKLFLTREFPWSGSKAKDGEEKKKGEKDWTMVITMAKLRMAHASTHGTRKPPGPTSNCIKINFKRLKSCRNLCIIINFLRNSWFVDGFTWK